MTAAIFVGGDPVLGAGSPPCIHGQKPVGKVGDPVSVPLFCIHGQIRFVGDRQMRAFTGVDACE